MFVRRISAEPQNILSPNLVWLFSIISQTVMQKNWFTVQCQGHSEELFLLCFLNCWSFCNQTWFDSTGLLFGSSGTAAGCLSWEVWWVRSGSTGLVILQSARSYCRLSWKRWLGLHHLHLLGPVLLGCCRLQPTSLSSLIVLQPPLLCEGWGGHPLCLFGDSPVLMDLHWPCDCTAQCIILSIGSISLVLL